LAGLINQLVMLSLSEESVDEVVVESKAGPLRAARPFVRAALGLLVLALVFTAVLFIRGWRPSSDQTGRPAPATAATAMPISAAIESTYGIRFTGVDVTAGGGMIQVRYQVIDSAKTEAIHGTDLAPYVVDGRGTKYADPGMVGHSHVGKTLAAGRTDYILLANAMGGVKHGSTVTIKVGDLELRGVPVL
jgi:hypothetical protein